MSSLTPKILNKAGRAKLAKETINKTIPNILKSNTQAREANNKSELIHYSPNHEKKLVHVPPTSEAGSSTPNEQPPPITPRVRVVKLDTFDAAHSILQDLHFNTTKGRVAVLNMASAMSPGGGVLRGALAQEEALCVRSTLYPSLYDEYYRIPESAAIYSHDVLVFRSSALVELPKSDWWFVDVISCAAIKNPDLVKDANGKLVYELEKDKEVMSMKVKLILQIAKEKNISHLVLGALGCGAYHNPPEEVAKIFKKVILGDRKRAGVSGIEEIVFAIFDEGENLKTFSEVFAESK